MSHLLPDGRMGFFGQVTTPIIDVDVMGCDEQECRAQDITRIRYDTHVMTSWKAEALRKKVRNVADE